jgi:hypothetical protein
MRVSHKKTLKLAAVGTSHQHGLEECTVCGRSGNMLKKKKNKDVLN